jgi:hypothetical protein
MKEVPRGSTNTRPSHTKIVSPGQPDAPRLCTSVLNFLVSHTCIACSAGSVPAVCLQRARGLTFVPDVYSPRNTKTARGSQHTGSSSNASSYHLRPLILPVSYVLPHIVAPYLRHVRHKSPISVFFCGHFTFISSKSWISCNVIHYSSTRVVMSYR